MKPKIGNSAKQSNQYTHIKNEYYKLWDIYAK